MPKDEQQNSNKVSKQAEGTKQYNTLVVDTIKLYFQCYPGERGTDEERGIAGVKYTLTMNKRSRKGMTAADGGIEFTAKPGTKAKLEIFDSTYEIHILDQLHFIEPKRAQQCLQKEGYYADEITGILTANMERALLNFQLDQSLQPIGLEDLRGEAKTYARLQTYWFE